MSLQASYESKTDDLMIACLSYKPSSRNGLCRNHAFDRFSQSFLEAYDIMDIEGI